MNTDNLYTGKLEVIGDKKSLIIREFEQKMKKLVSKYPEQEQKTWGRQLEEAEKLLSDSTVSTPMLDAILTGELGGITKEQLADKIVAKARALEVASGQLLAKKNKALRELDEQESN